MTGVTFDKKHSWRDWGLQLEDIDDPPPSPRHNLIAVPGMDGELDQSDCPNGITFEARDVTFTFRWKRRPHKHNEKRRQICNYINGRVCQVIDDEDPEYYYEGRCRVDKFKSNAATDTIVIVCRCCWKLRRTVTRITRDLTGTYQQIYLHNERRWVVPTITVQYATTVRMNGVTLDISAGTHRLFDLQLKEGMNIMEARLKNTNSGTITIEYQEASF